MHPTRLMVGLVLALGLAAGSVSCGGSDGGDPPLIQLTAYRGTQAPGDVWTYALGTTSFSATNETLGYDYAGTLGNLDNGYLRLTVTTSNDPDLAGQLPTAAYAVEVPGVALVVKPADPDGNVIVCVAVGQTPTTATTYNYVKFPDPDWGSGAGAIDDEEVWGRATSTISGAGGTTFDFWIEYWTMANTTATPSKEEQAGETFTATGGWLVPDAGDQRIGITPPGLLVQDSGPQSGGAMGVAAPGSALGLDALFTANREFLGFLFEYDTMDENTEAIWASVDQGGDSISAGGFVTGTGDFDDAVPAAEQVRAELVSEMTNGVYRGILREKGPDDQFDTADDVERAMVLLARVVANRYFLFGLVEPGDGGSLTSNVLLIEQ